MKQLLYLIIIISISLISNILNGQELTVHQGFWGDQYYEDDMRINRKTFIEKMNSDPLSQEYWRKYTRNAIGVSISAVATGVGIALWVNREENESIAFPVALTATGAILATIFNQNALKHKKNAILSYNKAQDVSLKVSPSKNGLGLALHF